MSADRQPRELFDLSRRVFIITGGGGLLGHRHAAAIAGFGGVPVLVDLWLDGAERAAQAQRDATGVDAIALRCDITRAADVESMLHDVLERFGRVDGLINNAANNPKVEDPSATSFSRVESFPLGQWADDIAVGLTGAFLCSRVVGGELARRGSGVIVNISSEYGMLAPDQRLYRKEGVADDQQAVKPISYTVVKSGLIGMTKYLATYWADRGVRVNALTVGGVENGQPDEFLQRASRLIPLGRMAKPDEYIGAIVFLCSDASSFMTGANLVVDGGKSVW
ncbi:MAG: SDR family oxidoreductase [Gemmatimonadaceae bacterium]